MSQFLINYLNLLVIFFISIIAPFVFIKLILPKIRKVLNNKNKKIFSNLINVKFFLFNKFYISSFDYTFFFKNIDI